MTTSVGVCDIGQKLPKKPASAEPASSRRRTVVCGRTEESYDSEQESSYS